TCWTRTFRTTARIATIHHDARGPFPRSPYPMRTAGSGDPLVYLVGAGPGNAGLLTLRAAECLARADLVLYDDLVPPRLLDLAPPAAERLCVTDLHGRHAGRVPLVNQTLIDAARRGLRTVR